MISIIGHSLSYNSHKKDAVNTLPNIHLYCTMYTHCYASYIRHIVLSVRNKQQIYLFLEIITVIYLKIYTVISLSIRTDHS